MKATDILMNEHRIIEQVLNCLEKILEQCTVERKLDAKSARQAIEFFRNFADRCHHGKEEAHLFPTMQANGFSGGCSPVAVMLREHELARLHIQDMDAAVDAAAGGNPQALEQFIQHGQAYLNLLREHIQKEDTCLFPAANHRLTERDQEQLLAAFEQFEAEQMKPDMHQAFLIIADELADRFAVPRAATPHSCCHSHAHP